jgi:hypothetical protein
LTAKTENCQHGENGTWCTITDTTILTLLPAGQTVRLLLKGAEGELLGALNMVLETLLVHYEIMGSIL